MAHSHDIPKTKKPYLLFVSSISIGTYVGGFRKRGTLKKGKNVKPWRCGIVVIVSVNRAEDHGFESPPESRGVWSFYIGMLLLVIRYELL
jgi:hypothetical protein